MNKDKKTDEEEIILPPYTGLRRVYTYQPYTVHRVKRMLKEIGCVAENINQGYKANRRVGYRELYRIKRISDGKVIHPCIDMESLRSFFAEHDFPLEKITLTINEASEYTGIGRTNLRQLITWNKIPIIKIGNKILIRCITLEHFLKVNEGNNLKNKYEVVAV